MEATGGSCASMEAHKSFKTSERLAPLAIISRVRFSAVNRDSAGDGSAILGPCLGSGLASCATPAASQSCISWFGLRRGSGELITFSILLPGLSPVGHNIRFKSGARHWCGFSFARQTAILHTHEYPTSHLRALKSRPFARSDLYKIVAPFSTSGEASMDRDWLHPSLRISTTTRPTSSCLYHYCLPAGQLPTSRLS